jgi:hypothetical protein
MTNPDRKLDQAAKSLQHKGYADVTTQVIAVCLFCGSPASLQIIELGETVCPSCAAGLRGRLQALQNSEP